MGVWSVHKRNGEAVEFDINKIVSAIKKAGRSTGEFGEEVARQLSLKVVTVLQQIISDENVGIEKIQDVVVEVLMSSVYKKTAVAYILYREKRTEVRGLISTDKSQISGIDNYLDRSDWRINENSNMSFSLQGLNAYISDKASATYWLHKVYTSTIREAHLHGFLHIHDLGSLSVYCVGWDLLDIIKRGFRGVAGKVASAPAKHLGSLLNQIVNFFYTLQGEASGAQALSHFDTLLAPFVRRDGLSQREVDQAIQEFIFNLNVPTRVGFQSPFTNIAFDLSAPKHLAGLLVIVGGEEQNETYGDFSKEIKMIVKAFLKVMREGDADGRIFTFPIPTFSITRDFPWDDKDYDFLWEVTGKYGIPYFANFVNSDLNPDDVRSMCCRLRLDVRTLRKKGGGGYLVQIR